MSAVINTNLASLFAQNALNNAQGNLATSVQRLSSGLRINSAKDDASGLAISQTMAAHIKALDQASLNAQQATNLAQTADTSLSTTQDILLRMQQLAVEGVNGSLSQDQRGAIVTELTNLNSQINAFAAGTTYNGIALLGAATTQDTGASNLLNGFTGTTNHSVVNNINVSNSKVGTYTLTQGVGVGHTTELTLSDLSGNSQKITVGSMPASGNMTVSFSNLGISFDVSGSSSLTGDQIAADITGKSIVTTAPASNSTSLSFQVGADPTHFSGDSISLQTINISTANGASQMVNIGTDIATPGSGLLAAQVTGTDAAWSAAFTKLQDDTKSALNYISTQRAILGSNMNQLGYINSNLVAQSANEQAARSTVVDTNYSAETSQLTKGQIMQQAATAMLAQANQMPNVILSLLK